MFSVAPFANRNSTSSFFPLRIAQSSTVLPFASAVLICFGSCKRYALTFSRSPNPAASWISAPWTKAQHAVITAATTVFVRRTNAESRAPRLALRDLLSSGMEPIISPEELYGKRTCRAVNETKADRLPLSNPAPIGRRAPALQTSPLGVGRSLSFPAVAGDLSELVFGVFCSCSPISVSREKWQLKL